MIVWMMVPVKSIDNVVLKSNIVVGNYYLTVLRLWIVVLIGGCDGCLR